MNARVPSNLPRLHPDPRPTRRLDALLVADDSHPAACTDTRSPRWPDRRVLYRAGDLDIGLHVQPLGPCNVALIGQLMPGSETWDEIAGTRIQLRVSGEVKQEIQTNDLGEFVFAHLNPYRYELRILLADQEVVITDLDL